MRLVSLEGPYAETRAAYTPKSSSTAIAKLLMIVPAASMMAQAAKVLLTEHQGRLVPRCFCAEGCVAHENVDAHILVVNSVAEKCADWGEELLGRPGWT